MKRPAARCPCCGQRLPVAPQLLGELPALAREGFVLSAQVARRQDPPRAVVELVDAALARFEDEPRHRASALLGRQVLRERRRLAIAAARELLDERESAA